jgi:hypothetical protein
VAESIERNKVNATDDSTINSSNYSDLRSSIIHSKTNKMLIDGVSSFYNIENTVVISSNVLKKYENIIMQYTVDLEIEDKYLLRPEYLSYDMYQTTDLWYLLLFINKMKSSNEFTKKNIKFFNPSYLDVINSIIEKEGSRVNNRENPEYVERSLIKGLNKPSDSILPKDDGMMIAPLDPPAKENVTSLTDFKTDFVNSYFPILRNKLFRKNYSIMDTSGNLASLQSSDLTPDFRLHPDCTTGLPVSWKNRYRQTFEGYIYADKSGKYTFKPIIMGSGVLSIDGKQVYNRISNNFSVNDNLFDEQTSNSDFRKGTTDGWDVLDGSLVDDTQLGKKVLRKSYNNTASGSNIARISLDVSKVNARQALAITTNYKSIDNRNNLFSGATAEVTYTNGRKDSFSNNHWYGNFGNTASYINAVLILTFQKGLTIKSIDINFPVSRKPYYNDVLNSEISISGIKVQEARYDEVEVELEGGRWHNISFQYTMIDQMSSYLQLLWMKPEDTIYSSIPSDMLSFTPAAEMRNQAQSQSAINSFYNKDESIMYTQRMTSNNNFSYDDLNPDPLFVPSGIDYTIKQDSRLQIIPNRKYRIEANKNDYVLVYKDNELWFEKKVGEEYAEKEDVESVSAKTVSLQTVYKHYSGTGKAYLNFKIYPDEYSNPQWNTFYTKTSYKPGEFLDPWGSTSNNVFLEPYASGITNYYYDKKDGLSDYRIETLLNTDSDLYFGNIGIIFRMQSEDEYYLYTITRENQPNGSQMNLFSGLYKVSPQFSEMNMTSDGMFKLRARLLKSTTQTYKPGENRFVHIMAFSNRIRIYDTVGGLPLIDYVDVENPFLTGSFGFHVFKQAEVNFSDIKVLY